MNYSKLLASALALTLLAGAGVNASERHHKSHEYRADHRYHEDRHWRYNRDDRHYSRGQGAIYPNYYEKRFYRHRDNHGVHRGIRYYKKYHRHHRRHFAPRHHRPHYHRHHRHHGHRHYRGCGHVYDNAYSWIGGAILLREVLRDTRY